MTRENNKNKNQSKNIKDPELKKYGFIQVYTGNGKGKTTASLGLSLRALGQNWKVLIILFVKGQGDYGELKTFANLNKKIKKNLKIVQTGVDRIVYYDNISQEDINQASKAWEYAKYSILKSDFNLIILDEINIAIDLKLINLKEVIEVLKNKPESKEIVLTGRNAKKEIIEIADLVSEINPIKHYYNSGIKSRKGIEY